MKEDPIFTNLFDQTDFSEKNYDDLEKHFSNDSCPFLSPIFVFPNYSDKIDDELFHIHNFVSKNAEIFPEETIKTDEKIQFARKNSSASLEEPLILTDFKVC